MPAVSSVPSEFNPASSFVSTGFEQLLARRISTGGFCSAEGGAARPDATAWALIALRSANKTWNGKDEDIGFLLKHQLEDGRVVLSREQPNTIWVTPLFILALYGEEQWNQQKESAINYLLSESGLHSKGDGAVVGHDMSILGWPWIDHTHSWVDSTALVMLAFRSAGFWKNDRFIEAQRLIMNRQLPSGGWNYGNTTVYGVELRPTPESTSIALTAMKGLVDTERLAKSIAYLHEILGTARTPLTLGWGILALDQAGSPGDKKKVVDCLADQARVGPYITEWLSLALMAGNFLKGATMPWADSLHEEKA